MLGQAPFAVASLMLINFALTLIFFFRSVRYSEAGRSSSLRFTVFFVVFLWVLLQAVLSYIGFYTQFSALPPRLILTGVGPAVIAVLVFLIIPSLRNIINGFRLEDLILLSVVRIPVEIMLHQLFTAGLVPEDMTYTGLNWDIFSGITAPAMMWVAKKNFTWSRSVLIVWHVLTLGLLINIVSIAILSAPFPFQQINFDQPNIAVFSFPFVFLPTFIVPMVLWATLTGLVKIYNVKK